MLTVSRSAVDFSGLGGIWDGPSHSGNVYCGQMNQYFRYFLGGMDAVCSGPKKKRIIQTVTSNKSKSQGLSWYGVVSVPLAKVTCTSVMAPLMLKVHRDFGAQYAAFKKHLFQGRPCIFQQDNAKPHSAHITKSWLRRKRVRVLDWPACSPDLSPIENVWRILKRKMRQRRPRTVAHLKTCLQEEWDKITPETLQSGKCFTVPTFFGMCCRSEWQERMYIYKWHEVDQTKHEIFCVHIVCNEIQVKVNLEITTFFFYLRFPYCPNFFWFGVVCYIYIHIHIKHY